MPLNNADNSLIKAMLDDDCTIAEILTAIPHASERALYRRKANWEAFGSVTRPSSAQKERGAPRKITPIMRQYLLDYLSLKNDVWQEELVFELWTEFDVVVHRSTVSRMLKEAQLSKKVNTRVASGQSDVEQGLYLEDLAALLAQRAEGVDPAELLLFLDESAASEKVMFRRRSWSQIGLPAFTRAKLVNKTRCSVLPALDIQGYVAGATLVVEGSITQAIYEDWLENVVLVGVYPQGAQEDALHRSSTSDVFVQIACGRPPELAARRAFSQPVGRPMGRSLYTGNLLSLPRTGNAGLCTAVGRSCSMKKMFESVVHHATADFVADRLRIVDDKVTFGALRARNRSKNKFTYQFQLHFLS